MKITKVFKSMIVAMVIAGALMMAAPTANAAVFVGIGIAPPAIPVYAQPIAPGYGYIWTPGYWAYGPDGYYWVDGAWVYPPYIGALWTPGYWGWGVGGYFWHAGYWGRTIGYYGGINYGFGYFGTGFYGGYWNGGHYFYNGAYNHIGFHNGYVYNHPVSGFNGRPGGASFVRGGTAVAENRGAGINGNSFTNRNFSENRGGAQPGFRNGTTANAARPQFNGGGNGLTQSRGSYSAPAPQSRGGYSAPAPQARGFGGGNAGGGARPSFSGGGSRGGGRR